jgi:hypothetical protein
VILTFISGLSVINSMIRFSFVESIYLLAVGLVLLVIAMVMGSDLGIRTPMLLVGLVWVLHLSVGLAVIRLAIVNLARWRATVRWPDLGLLLLAGLIASLVLAPVSLVIDQWLMSRGVDSDDEFLLGRSPQGWVILLGLCEEWIQVVGPTLLVSVLLSIPAWRPALSKCFRLDIK